MLRGQILGPRDSSGGGSTPRRRTTSCITRKGLAWLQHGPTAIQENPYKIITFVGSNGSDRSRTEILFNKKKGPKLDLLVWRSLKIWMFYSNFKKHTQFDTQNQWDEISMAICWFPNLNYAHFKICLADSTKNSPVWVDWACYQLRRCRIM